MRNKNLILSGLLLFALLANFASGADNPLFPPDPCGALVGKLTVSAPPEDIAISGSYAYLTGAEGLKIVDVSNPARPALKGSFNPGAPLQGVAVSARYVLAGSLEQGKFRSISVANPASPKVFKTLNLGGINPNRAGQTQVFLYNNYAYIAGDSDVKIVNVSNPANPFSAGSLPADPQNQFTRTVYVAGKYAYAGQENKIFDITDPAKPVLKGKLGALVPQGTAVVYGTGNYVYTSAGAVLDVSDPAAPKQIKAPIQYLAVTGILKQKGQLLYGATGNGFKIIDATDPVNPKLLKEVVLTQGKTRALALQGNYVYLANLGSADHLMVAKITDCKSVPKPSPAVYLGDRRLAGPVSIIDCGQTYTFKVDNYSHSQVWLEQTKNNLPTYNNVFVVPNTHQSACFRDEGSYTNKFYILTAGQRGDLLGEVDVDIKPPTNAPAVAFYSGGTRITESSCGDAYTLKVDNYPYSRIWVEQTKSRDGAVVGKSEGLLSNPFTYTSVCSRGADPEGDIGHFVTNVFSAVNGQKGAQHLGSAVFDVTHRPPTACGTVDAKYTAAGQLRQIAVEGIYLYAVDSTGLAVIDITDPKKPSLKGKVAKVGAEALLVSGKYVYLGTRDAIVVVDVSNPAKPEILESVNLSGPAGAASRIVLKSSGNTLYAGRPGTLNILNIANPAGPSEIARASLPAGFDDLAVAGQSLYVTGDGFRVINAQNGSEVGKIGDPNIGGAVVVAGNYAYASSKFSVIDIRDPRSPKLIKQDAALDGDAIFKSEDFLYVSRDKLKTIDVSKPASPRLIHTTELANSAGKSVEVIGDTAYVADGRDAVLLDLGDCVDPDQGGGPGGGQLQIDRIDPDPLYINEDNSIFISGANIGPDAQISVDNSGLQILQPVVNDNGAGIQATVRVTTRAGPQDKPIFTIISDDSSASRQAGLAIRPADAPKIVDISVAGDTVTVSGTNFSNVTAVEVIGVPNVLVSDFQIVSATQLKVTLSVEELGYNLPALLARFTKFAQAAGSQGILLVQNPSGSSSYPFSRQQLAGGQGPGSQNIPDTGFGKICPKDGGIALCIKNIYLLALGLGALLALLMMILSGYRYLTAEGNSQQVENAKEAFGAAIIGVIVIFIAFILLNVINPDLVRFKKFEFPTGQQ